MEKKFALMIKKNGKTAKNHRKLFIVELCAETKEKQ